MKSSSNHVSTTSSVAAMQGQSVDGHYEIEVARQRLAAGLRVLDVAVNVDDNARKMMEISSTNVIATNIATVAGAQQGNKELKAAIKIDDNARRMIDFLLLHNVMCKWPRWRWHFVTQRGGCIKRIQQSWVPHLTKSHKST